MQKEAPIGGKAGCSGREINIAIVPANYTRICVQGHQRRAAGRLTGSIATAAGACRGSGVMDKGSVCKDARVQVYGSGLRHLEVMRIMRKQCISWCSPASHAKTCQVRLVNQL